jgi:hypothetical protein
VGLRKELLVARSDMGALAPATILHAYAIAVPHDVLDVSDPVLLYATVVCVGLQPGGAEHPGDAAVPYVGELHAKLVCHSQPCSVSCKAGVMDVLCRTGGAGGCDGGVVSCAARAGT